MADRKAYHGRLAFDPDTDFHIDPEGKPVVTFDDGVTWFYATDGDTSHAARHHQQTLVVDGTQIQLIELQLEHGREKAEQLMKELHPHHYDPLPDDPHYVKGAKDEAGKVHNTRIKFSPDHVAETETSHTAAWAGGK